MLDKILYVVGKSRGNTYGCDNHSIRSKVIDKFVYVFYCAPGFKCAVSYKSRTELLYQVNIGCHPLSGF